MFCLATYIKAIKPYALNPNTPDISFVNAVLVPFIDAGGVSGQNNTYYDLDKTRVSRLLAQKSDVPEKLRNALKQNNIVKKTESEFREFMRMNMDTNQIQAVVEAVSNLIKNDKNLSSKTVSVLLLKIDKPELFLADALVEAIRARNDINFSNVLWNCGTSSFGFEIGDLLSYGFGKTRKQKEIVVIPVNTTFDTKISWQYEHTLTPLVSEATLHGKWLIRMEDSGVSIEELDKRIEENLQLQNIKHIASHGKGTSPKPEYPKGTIAVIENNRAVFYLLALTSFDENNNAQATKEEIQQSLKDLLLFYNHCGQGLNLYLPLLGTGMTRIAFSHQDSFEMIQSTILDNKEHIPGKITVVIYKGDIDKIDLTEKAKNEL